MQADRAHWIYIAEAAHRMGCDSQKICVCVCVCVLRRDIWLGNTRSLYWAHIFQSLLYEANWCNDIPPLTAGYCYTWSKACPSLFLLTTSFFFFPVPPPPPPPPPPPLPPSLMFLSHWFSLSLLLSPLSHPLPLETLPLPPPTSVSNCNLSVV